MAPPIREAGSGASPTSYEDIVPDPGTYSQGLPKDHDHELQYIHGLHYYLKELQNLPLHANNPARKERTDIDH